MSGVGNLKVLSNPITQTFNQDSSFPVTATNGVAAVIYNYDISNILIVEFTHYDDKITEIEIPPSTAWEDIIQKYKSLDIGSGSLSSAFIVHLKEFRDAI